MSASDLIAVVWLPAGRVAQHLPLPAGDDGVPQTPAAWAASLLAGAEVPEGACVAVVAADTGLCGPDAPPPDATPLTR